jgi:hypothetical protein
VPLAAWSIPTPKLSPLLAGVGASLRVALPLAKRAGPSQRLGRAVANLFGAADDLPVTLGVVLTAFHASIIALHQPFRHRFAKPS